MNEILPAIIASDFSDLNNKLSKVEGLVSFVHLDIMDGVFTPQESWNNPDDLKKINTNLNLEAHFMVSDIDNALNSWLDSKIKRFIFHFEALDVKDISKISLKIKSHDKEFGLALKMDTDISKVLAYLDLVDVIQLMSIDKIGYYGEGFDARVIPKIDFLHQMQSNVKISVDGGINYESAKILLNKGVARLDIGSSIFKSDNIKDSIKKFQNL